MQAVWVTINQWNSFVSLCTRVGVPRPAYAGVSHPKTGEMGYLFLLKSVLIPIEIRKDNLLISLLSLVS